MNTTLSEHEIRYYRSSVENQIGAIETEIASQRAFKEPGHEEALKILEALQGQTKAVISGWERLGDLFYPVQAAKIAS